MSDAYRAAGVDTEAAAKAVTPDRRPRRAARRPEVADSVGGFAGLFRVGGGTAAGGRDRRGRDEARDRAADRAPRHGRDRPRRDVCRRRRVHRRGAAVLPRLPRGRAGSCPNAWPRSSRGSPRGAGAPGARSLGGETAEHPGRDARRPVRPRGVLRGGGARGATCSAPTAVREGDVLDRPAVERSARERLLARAACAARRLRLDEPGAGARPVARRRAAGAVRDPRARGPGARTATGCSTPRRTSPAAGSSRTSRDACPPGSARGSSGDAGASPRSSGSLQREAGALRRRPVLDVQHGSRDGARGRARARRSAVAAHGPVDRRGRAGRACDIV